MTIRPMMGSNWFIHHPKPTILLTAAAVLLGVVAFPLLSIAPLPQVDFPTIQVQASLPGASAETMASAVATPLEVQLSNVPGITEMTAGSVQGQTQITLQFLLEKNIDTAAQEVQAAITAASGLLPKSLPNQPVWRKANPSDPPILVFAIHSKLMTLPALSDAIEVKLQRPLSQIQGVSQVWINGQRRPALRIQASPAKLAAYGLTLADIRQAVESTTVNNPKGALYGQQQTSTLATNDQIFDPASYNQLVIAYRKGRPVQLGDVARVIDSAQDIYASAWQDGMNGFQLGVNRQPGSNIVQTAERVMDAMAELKKSLPASMEVELMEDRTQTIRASLHDVGITLVVSMVLVILVMSLFLRQTSATLIVGAILCVSLLSTLALMYAFGFSLNNLTLVALVIAVGFIVDDAIVVVENIHRHLENGEAMMQAALKGASEISFTIITISFSLIAVFIPLLFMSGIIGRIFREFALTVTSGILVSVLTALTLAPMLASRYMKPQTPPHDTQELSIPRWLVAQYDRGLTAVLAHQTLVLVIFGVTVAASVLCYVLIPKGFFPQQDTGFVFASTQAAQDISFEGMIAKQHAVSAIVQHDPAVEHYGSALGGSRGPVSQGNMFIMLKRRNERDVSAAGFIDRMRPLLQQVPGIQTFLRPAQDINLSGFGARAQFVYVSRSTNNAVLYRWAQRLAAPLAKRHELTDVSSDLELGARVTRLTIDRAAAARFGISTDDIDQALYDAFGQRQVTQYQTQPNQYYVLLEIDPSVRGPAASLPNV